MNFTNLLPHHLLLLFGGFVNIHDVSGQLPLPFGAGTADISTVPPGDNGSSFEITLIEPMCFLGSDVTSVYQNMDGNVSFDAPFNTISIKRLPSTDVPGLLAVYWSDIDTLGCVDFIDDDTLLGNRGELWARTTNSPSDLTITQSLVAATGGDGASMFTPTSAFVATWDRVEAYSSISTVTGLENTFQGIMATDTINEQTWVIFAYDQIDWFETISSLKSVIGLNGSTGIDGQTIQLIEDYADLPNLTTGTNTNSPGIYAYRVDVLVKNLPLPFGSGTADILTPPNDDGSSVKFTLIEQMRFLGKTVTSVYQNTNGNISFNLPFDRWTPELIPSATVPNLLAVYWSDIDARYGDGKLWSRTTDLPSDLKIIRRLVSATGGNGASIFKPTSAFVATWYDVRKFPSDLPPYDETNTFQGIIATDTVNKQTWVVLAYEQMDWLHQFSSNSVIGFNDEAGIDGQLIKEIESASDLASLMTETNTGVPGIFAFRVDTDFELTGCGVLTNTFATFEPLYGPDVGGTVLQITNLPQCLDDPNIEIYCRFELGNGRTFINEGYRASRSVVGCITPYVGETSSAEVFYTPHDPATGPFNAAAANWIDSTGEFQFVVGPQGVALYNAILLTLTSKDVTAKWSPNSLVLDAFINFYDVFPATTPFPNFSVDVDIMALDEPNDNFVLVKSIPVLSSGSGSTTFNIGNGLLSPYSIDITIWGITFQIGIVVVRVVAYIMTSGKRHIYSARSSREHFVLPPLRRLRILQELSDSDKCPMKPKSECQAFENTPPCPPFYDMPSNFRDDEICPFPAGQRPCVPDGDILIDTVQACNKLKETFGSEAPEFLNDLCLDVPSDFDVNATGGGSKSCSCHSFHEGAAGCIRNGSSQCCYSETGALILDPKLGAGTFACTSSENDYWGHFIDDVLPYIRCCELGTPEQCDDYYEERSPISSEGYEIPDKPAAIRGDPHIRTFDGTHYTFNGAGEYVALCGLLVMDDASTSDEDNDISVAELLQICDPSKPRLSSQDGILSVNLRLAPFNPEPEDSFGTVTVGIAIEDPTHENGQKAIVIVPHPERRFDIYNGHTRVLFPLPFGPFEDTVEVKLLSGVSIKRSADLLSATATAILEIVFPSGLQLQIQEVGGVLLPSVFRPMNKASMRGNGLTVGLFGTSNGDVTDDLTSALGVTFDLTDYGYGDNYQADLSADVFANFGQTWMIRTESSSLFQAFSDSSLAFDDFLNPDYVPIFDISEIAADPALEAAANAVCGSMSDERLQWECYFDVVATGGNADLFEIIYGQQALDEIQSRLTPLENQLPTILEGGNDGYTVLADVVVNQQREFPIVASDADDDDELTATLIRSDSELFQLDSVAVDDGEDDEENKFSFVLTFLGSPDVGETFTGLVSITDGIASRLVGATVTVVANDETSACEAGSYKGGAEDGSTTCLPCEAGTFSSTVDAQICTPCADRTISDVGATECTPCLEGHIEVGNKVCEICPAGTCQAGDLNECVPCEPGLFQPNAGQNFCLQCPVGRFSDVEGLATCKTCPEGSVAPRGSIECKVCVPPKVESRRRNRCVDPVS